MSRKNWVRERALEIGFDRVGIARLDRAQYGPSFLDWLDRGDHAGMEYMAGRREVRLDPRLIFDGARSAICVALQYHSEETPEEAGDLWPRVARYAKGRDYHNVMIKRLRKLARAIREEFPGTETRPYVDTGPILERSLAAAAGLGVPGKNTMLLHPEAGSYFLLGELFVSLDLAPDNPIEDLCGSCSLCLEACPTNALPAPFRLDSNRCISYWTIEHRGAVAPDIREQIGDWVFGCDICQEVCPHNDRVEAPIDPAFDLPEQRRALDLVALSELDESRYQEVFQGSPMKRSRREGLRRNAIVAMGNRGDQQYVEPLLSALGDEDASVRLHAAWALGRIGDGGASTRLREALEREVERTVAKEMSEALNRLSKSHDDRDLAPS